MSRVLEEQPLRPLGRLEDFTNDQMKKLKDELDRLQGRGKYKGDMSNPSYGDGYYAASLFREYGYPIDELEKALKKWKEERKARKKREEKMIDRPGVERIRLKESEKRTYWLRVTSTGASLHPSREDATRRLRDGGMVALKKIGKIDRE